jgi:hypothetical protein
LRFGLARGEQHFLRPGAHAQGGLAALEFGVVERPHLLGRIGLLCRRRRDEQGGGECQRPDHH